MGDIKIGRKMEEFSASLGRNEKLEHIVYTISDITKTTFKTFGPQSVGIPDGLLRVASNTLNYIATSPFVYLAQ